MGMQVIVEGRNLDVYNDNGVKYYNNDSPITVTLDNVTTGETGWNL